MRQEFLNIYKVLSPETGVLVGGSTALYLQGLQETQPQDLDLCIYPSKYNLLFLDTTLRNLGYTCREFDNINFGIRRQYERFDNKIDIFFIAMHCTKVEVNGIDCMPASGVWAARGYFAAQGYEKAQKQ